MPGEQRRLAVVTMVNDDIRSRAVWRPFAVNGLRSFATGLLLGDERGLGDGTGGERDRMGKSRANGRRIDGLFFFLRLVWVDGLERC